MSKVPLLFVSGALVVAGLVHAFDMLAAAPGGCPAVSAADPAAQAMAYDNAIAFFLSTPAERRLAERERHASQSQSQSQSQPSRSL